MNYDQMTHENIQMRLCSSSKGNRTVTIKIIQLIYITYL